MEMPSVLSVMPMYVAIFGLLFLPLTIRAGAYRLKSKIFIGTGEDPELLRRVRGQANFIETVPIALFLLIMMEVLRASDAWLHVLGASLVAGRVAHYLGLTNLGPPLLRVIGMSATLLIILVSSIWILVKVL